MTMDESQERIQSMDIVVTELSRIHEEIKTRKFGGPLGRLLGRLMRRRST
jgi:hypothetical protein